MFINQPPPEIVLTPEEEQLTLSESYIPIKNDRTYMRNTQYIMICTLDSIVPRLLSIIDPDYLSGGISEFTFNEVKEFFSFLPIARKNQVPFHFYTEIFQNNYVSMVGAPKSSSSWVIDLLVQEGLLSTIYQDSILICLQENYANEPLERNLMEVLTNDLVTPLMREYKFSYNRVVFLENVIDRDMLSTSKYFNHIKQPKHLLENLFHVYLKKYVKR